MKVDAVQEIYLQPGDVWFGGGHVRVRTVLGSCVAITLWHPRRQIGGMCHYMLPGRVRRPGEAHCARYADDAVALMVRQLRGAGCAPDEFEAKLFGGGRMFATPQWVRMVRALAVHERNVDAARDLVRQYGFRLAGQHLGGHGHRQVVFDVASGHAWLKHTPLAGHASRGH